MQAARALAVEARHWDLWAHLCRTRYADGPGLSGPDYWPSEPDYEGDDHPVAYSRHPDDEGMAERIGQGVRRLPGYERRILVAWFDALPGLPRAAHIRALTLKVDPKRMAEEWPRLVCKVESGLCI